MNKFTYFVLALFIPLICGCIKKTTSHTIKTLKAPKKEKITIPDNEAIQLSDLPIPLGFNLKAYERINTITYVCFQGKLITKKIVSFFETDTERNGWILEKLALPIQEIYCLTKPCHKAVIRIEQKTSKTLIHINLKKSNTL